MNLKVSSLSLAFLKSSAKLLFNSPQIRVPVFKKMSFESGKTMAEIGALLLFIPLPFLGIVGLILLLLGLKDLADYYKDNNIFQDALYAVIFGIIGTVVAAIFLISFLYGGAFIGMASPGSFLGLAIGALVGFALVLFVFYILMAWYFKKALDALADKTGEGMFRTAGTLLLIGAILTIIFVGLIIIFIAWILATVGFFSIKATAAPPPPPPSPTPPAP